MMAPRRSGRGARRVIGAAALWVLSLAVPRPGLSLMGDCNADGFVRVNELIIGVNIALERTAAVDCRAWDPDGDGRVGIADLVATVAVVLSGRPQQLLSGTCDQPAPGSRQSGTRPCEDRTVVRVARCDVDKDTCLHEAAARTVLGSGAVAGTEGQFAVSIPRQPPEAWFYIEAELREAGNEVFPYRAIQRNGSQGSGGSQAVAATAGALDPAAVVIDPSSEGTVEVVDQLGLERFTDEQIAALTTQVRQDPRAQYGGLSLACAANLGAGIAASFSQGSVLTSPSALAVDSAGNVFVADGIANVFRITPGGEIHQIIDAMGDGHGHMLGSPRALAVDADGNVVVAGSSSNNVFRITPPPHEEIRQIIDVDGDGARALSDPLALAVDADRNVFVAGAESDNVFRITPSLDIQQIIDARGDLAGDALDGPSALAVDADRNVFVAGAQSDNVFRITPSLEIRQIIDATGEGHALSHPEALAVDVDRNVFVAGLNSGNVFRITSGGEIRQIIDAMGDLTGHPLDFPIALAADAAGNVFVAGVDSNNVFRITPPPDEEIRQIIDVDGDGVHALSDPVALAVDAAGNVFAASLGTNTVFKISPCGFALSVTP